MSVKSNKKPIKDNSTQRYLPFSEVRDNIIIMKDGSSRMVLKCSTINFLLKSEEEQDAIIMSYQRFINSLDFPVQIMVRSSKLDIEGYLTNLNSMAVKQENEKLQTQTYEYIEYLQKLIEYAQIMKKDFYIVVPFDGVEDKSVRDNSIGGMISNFMASISGSGDITKIKAGIRNLEKSRKGLYSRANSVKTALDSIGIKAQELDKKEVVKLMVDYYNPTMDNNPSLKTALNSTDLL